MTHSPFHSPPPTKGGGNGDGTEQRSRRRTEKSLSAEASSLLSTIHMLNDRQPDDPEQNYEVELRRHQDVRQAIRGLTSVTSLVVKRLEKMEVLEEELVPPDDNDDADAPGTISEYLKFLFDQIQFLREWCEESTLYWANKEADNGYMWQRFSEFYELISESSEFWSECCDINETIGRTVTGQAGGDFLGWDTVSSTWKNLVPSIFGSVLIEHTASEADEHALAIIADAAGFGDMKAIDIGYITGAIGAGEDEGVILVNIDESEATGGQVIALVVVTTTEGSEKVVAVATGVGVDPIAHNSGAFVNMDSLLVKAVDERAALISGGAGNVSVFVADNDTMTIGDADQWAETEFIVDTGASGAGIKPVWEYSTGVGTWAAFTPTDGTNAFKNTGLVLWDPTDLAGWVVGTGSEFLIRITRTRNTLATTPILDLVQIADPVAYGWNKDGDLTIKGFTGKVNGISPTASSHLATKGYVGPRYDRGPSNPLMPAAGDRWNRSTDEVEFIYDGALWLSTYHVDLHMNRGGTFSSNSFLGKDRIGVMNGGKGWFADKDFRVVRMTSSASLVPASTEQIALIDDGSAVFTQTFDGGAFFKHDTPNVTILKNSKVQFQYLFTAGIDDPQATIYMREIG